MGSSFGYFRGRERENSHDRKEKTRTYGINAELAYIKDKQLALLGIGVRKCVILQRKRADTEKRKHIFLEKSEKYMEGMKETISILFCFFYTKIEGEKIVPGSELGFRYTGYWTDTLSGKFQVGYRREWIERKRENRYRNQWDFCWVYPIVIMKI